MRRSAPQDVAGKWVLAGLCDLAERLGQNVKEKHGTKNNAIFYRLVEWKAIEMRT